MNAPTSSPTRSPRISADSLRIEKLDDRRELQDFLVQDKLANAYLLGDLDPDYFPFCHWYGTRAPDGTLESILCHYTGLSLPAVLAIGSEVGVETLLTNCSSELPDRFHFHVTRPHLETLREDYELDHTRQMRRMGLHRSRHDNAQDDRHVRRLDHGDTAAIMKLYEHYPDNLFEPTQLETGYYFGVDGDDGDLLSIAGVHVVSEDYDVAAIGNLVTHPEARGQGYATACTGRLLDELFEQVSLVALNVREDNSPAISVYTSFGFQQNSTFWEGRAVVEDEAENC